jgi:hypothetical protein
MAVTKALSMAQALAATSNSSQSSVRAVMPPSIRQPSTAASPAVEEVEGVDTWPYCYLYRLFFFLLPLKLVSLLNSLIKSVYTLYLIPRFPLEQSE